MTRTKQNRLPDLTRFQLLVTTRQQSAIEHESPNTKITEIGGTCPAVSAAAVYSGDISWAENLHDNIENRCLELARNDEIVVDGSILMRVASQEYQNFLNTRIDNQILSKYGIGIDDLQAQHKFKDGFIADIKTEIENAESTINDNLHLVVGGVNRNVNQGFVFDVVQSDHFRHSNEGYAAIGSGNQPASSEFIESEYGPQKGFDTCVATVTAATLRARRASGVGGDIDIWAVTQNGIQEAPERIVAELEQRFNRIATIQDKVKENLRSYHTVEWTPGQ